MKLQCYCSILLFALGIQLVELIKFDIQIAGYGEEFYEIIMSLGRCNYTLLFTEYKIFPPINYNRVLDIYYKSSNTEYLVSKVEIQLLINNTDCAAYSTMGVGGVAFSAYLVLPSNIGISYYSIDIFTCSKTTAITPRTNSDETSSDFSDRNESLIPFYIRPDHQPDHIYLDIDSDEDNQKDNIKSDAARERVMPISFLETRKKNEN